MPRTSNSAPAASAASAASASRASEASPSGNGHAGPAAAGDATGAAASQTLPGGWAKQLRQPVSWGLQTLMLALHAGEEFQRAQLDCWHLALKRREEAHQRLVSCKDSAEMASLQADLMRFDTANMTHLSQRYLDTVVHLNTDLARLAAEMVDGSRNHWVRSAFESFQSGIRTGIRPLDDIFNAPLLQELARHANAGASPKQ